MFPLDKLPQMRLDCYLDFALIGALDVERLVAVLQNSQLVAVGQRGDFVGVCHHPDVDFVAESLLQHQGFPQVAMPLQADNSKELQLIGPL